MKNVEFEDEQNLYYRPSDNDSSGLVGFLIRRGIFPSKRTANAFLFLIFIFCISFSIFIFFSKASNDLPDAVIREIENSTEATKRT